MSTPPLTTWDSRCSALGNMTKRELCKEAGLPVSAARAYTKEQLIHMVLAEEFGVPEVAEMGSYRINPTGKG